MKIAQTYRKAVAALLTAYLGCGCLTAAEPQRTRRGSTTPWRSTFEKVDWLAEWNPQRHGRFGLDNLSVHEEPGQPIPRFLRAQYYKGGASPSASRRVGVKEGGGQMLGTLPDGPVDALYLRYWVRFAPDFDFVKGGKLPGFYGGTMISGGNIPDGTNGFSTRMMWRTDGMGEVYIYGPTSTKFGTSLGRGSFTFAKGRWHCVEQRLILNTPSQLDGQVHIWLDEKPVFSDTRLLLRTVGSLKIEGVFFSTFFGGGDPSWAPPRDTYADFADFATSSKRLGCPGLQTPEQPTSPKAKAGT
ncbi:MAG: hypothetical protein SF187_18640 [Deltaproteobacteria bacterium]|nr:hypothetical protein [Deltaproteobacteria bacterium]